MKNESVANAYLHKVRVYYGIVQGLDVRYIFRYLQHLNPLTPTSSLHAVAWLCLLLMQHLSVCTALPPFFTAQGRGRSQKDQEIAEASLTAFQPRQPVSLVKPNIVQPAYMHIQLNPYNFPSLYILNPVSYSLYCIFYSLL